MYELLLKKVKGITDNSREVKKGYLFVAVKGLSTDGHNFIPQAINDGAIVIIGEKNLKIKGATYIRVKDSRKALSILASEWFGNPSRRLKIIGVTGTDGKTTTATLIYWILKAAGKKVGLISTVSAKIGSKEYDTGFHVTNPEPVPLQGFLAKMVKEGCEYAVLEVTSHGLAQDRVYGINFDIGVLTNITHEHLDYHQTFTNYVKAKAKLFQASRQAILNENYEKDIADFIPKSVEKTFYNDQTLAGEVRNSVLQRFKEHYNLLNSTAAVICARQSGVKNDIIIEAIKSFPGIEGRMEEIKNDKGIRIIVDFAHTPNALENVLTVLKGQRPKKARLIAIFGCAGERDVAKRPMMAEISTRLADISVFTVEDPRSERIEDIILQMEKGIKNKRAKVYKIPERGEAISFAVNKLARKGDIVVVCGKGHEKSMNYNGVEYLWSDHEAVEMSLKGQVKQIKRQDRVAILGLGIEGMDLAHYFLRKGIRPVILDENSEVLTKIEDPKIKKLKIIIGGDVLKSLEDFKTVYRSPGVYRYRKELLQAEKSGVRIESSIKLFFDECPGQVVGVTGTKGKGTTSTLIYEILKSAGKDVYLAGNIGKPYLELLPKLNKNSIVVLELSSFQLIDLTKNPHVAVVLNITSDHLNWHKNRGEYIDAKKNIVRYQSRDDFAVINKEYETPRSFAKETKARVLFFSKKSLENKYKEKVILLGEHNLENVAAAVTVAKTYRVDDDIVKKVLANFKGLEHRLELIKEVEGVSFYNDSFSTNPEPTIAAVRAFEKPMTLILGGYDKGLDYSEMGEEISKNKNVINIILIGDTSRKIKKALLKSGFKGKIFEMGKPTMKEIVRKGFSITPRGGALVLSPASASFDMFKDYKDRGKQFKSVVLSLANA